MKTFSLITIALFFIAIDAFSSLKQTFDFEIIENRIIVKFEINNKILNLLFDTGSNLSILDSTKASQLDLPYLAQTVIPTPGGNIEAYRTKFDLFKEFNINWVVTSLHYQTNNLKYPVDGLLGANEILQKTIVDIDFKNQKIHFGNTDQELKIKFIPIHLKDGSRLKDSEYGRYFSAIPVVKANIILNNKRCRVDLIVDTGCRYNFSVLTQDSTIIKKYTTQIEDYYLLNGDKRLINFGNVCIDDSIKTICDMVPFFYDPLISQIYDNDIVALVGIPFLKNYKRIIIDWPEKVIYVKKWK